MPICVCARIFMRVRESRGVTGKPSPAVRSIRKPRSCGIPHYITPFLAGNPRVPAIIPRGGNPGRPLLYYNPCATLGLCFNFEFELFICVRILLTKCRLILLIIFCLYETYICLFISIVFP